MILALAVGFVDFGYEFCGLWFWLVVVVVGAVGCGYGCHGWWFMVIGGDGVVIVVVVLFFYVVLWLPK